MAKIIPMAAFNGARGRQQPKPRSNRECTIILFDGVRYEPIPERDDNRARNARGRKKRRAAV